MREEWKFVPGWEGYYSVSNAGNVKSEPRKIIERNSNKSQFIPGRMLKQTLNNIGKLYFRVSLSRNGKIKYAPVHQLVCWAFIGPQEKGQEVRHLNGNCQDNNLSNLCYGSKSDNMQDAIKHGTFPLYEKRPCSVLTKKLALLIASQSGTLADIAKQYNVSMSCVRQIKTGETWSDITKEARALNPYQARKRK